MTRGWVMALDALVAALALDGWELGSTARRYPWPESVTAGVVRELRTLAV